MIPLVIPPLTGLQILVTRPAIQADKLCARLAQLGGTVLHLPVLQIQPCEFVTPATNFDLLIFISTNAVQHGQAVLHAYPEARLAAVGTATVQALQALGHQIDITPEHAANSESLLTHPLLQSPPAHVMIVRGSGGRELLRDTLGARGSEVQVLEVYQRLTAIPDADAYRAVQQQLFNDELDIISITSVETLHALHNLLDDQSLQYARQCTLLLGSQRIASAARATGWSGECIIADSPEDNSMLTALTRWHTRARSELLR